MGIKIKQVIVFYSEMNIHLGNVLGFVVGNYIPQYRQCLDKSNQMSLDVKVGCICQLSTCVVRQE